MTRAPTQPRARPGSRSVVRPSDVAVIVGSETGLAAALPRGRQPRSVIVVDSGEPRNAAAAHMHSFLGRDGTPPTDLLVDGRREVRAYGGEILTGQAVRVTRAGARFTVELSGGRTIVARRVIAATGLSDELPDIEGLAGLWG